MFNDILTPDIPKNDADLYEFCCHLTKDEHGDTTICMWYYQGKVDPNKCIHSTKEGFCLKRLLKRK